MRDQKRTGYREYVMDKIRKIVSKGYRKKYASKFTCKNLALIDEVEVDLDRDSIFSQERQEPVNPLS